MHAQRERERERLASRQTAMQTENESETDNTENRKKSILPHRTLIFLLQDEISNSSLPECQAVVNLAGENILNPLKR